MVHTAKAIDGIDRMSQPSSYVELLKSTPITELSVANKPFLRLLERNGYTNIIEALDAPYGDIIRICNDKQLQAYDSLQKKYNRDPEAFAKETLELPRQSHPMPAHRPSSPANTTHSTVKRWQRDPLDLSQASVGLDISSYLYLPFMQKLSDYDDRAQHIFNELQDRQDNVIVYQAFDAFATEFDEINKCFQELFRHYQHAPRKGLAIVKRFLENIFLIYVADRARTFHDKGFWSNFFPTIHISEANSDAQSAFKQLFYTGLQDKNMPVYQEDESARHYYLTALLHGGL